MSAMRESDSPAAEPQFSAPSKPAPRAGHRRSHSLTTNSLVRHTLHVTPEQQAYVNGLIDKWEAKNPPKPFKPFELPAEFAVRFSALSNAAAEPLLPQRDDLGAPERAGPSEEHRSVALPPTNREEQMDTTASRKRSREEVSSDDEEDGPRKQSATSPADPEPSDEDNVPTQCTEETGTEATTPASLDEAAAAAVTSSAAQTTSSSPSPALLPSGDTLVANAAGQGSGSPPPAPAAAETPTTPLDSLSAEAEAMDEATVDNCTQETTRKTTPATAMAFLRSPTTGEQPASRKRKKKGRKTARKQHTPAAPLSTSAVSSSAGPSAPPADPVTTGRPPVLTPAVTRPPESQPNEVSFQEVKSKAALRRARKITTAALPVDPAVVGTVLFRPSAPGGSFRGTPRLSIAQALPSNPGVADIRVNHHRNIVAVDATSQECLTLLLALTELRDIPITAREPADGHTSMGFIHGVDEDPAEDTLLPGLQSAVPVLAATKEGRTVTLRFGGPVPPERVALFRVHFPVRPARPRPLQCKQCSRYGHVREACRWPDSCIRCGRTHTADADCQRPRCVNCGGPHSADTPHCPRWQEQRQVASIMASSTTALSRRVVAAAVREETREARTYASAVKGHTLPARPVPAPRNRRKPAPVDLTAAAALEAPPADAAPTAQPGVATALATPPTGATAPEAQAAVDHVTQIVISLLLTLQDAEAKLPHDHPFRAICQLAAALQQPTSHHDDFSLHLQREGFDVLALQEVYAQAEEVRLPGYVGYSSRTRCTLDACHAAPCLDDCHPQGTARCAVYVKRELLQAEVPVADLVGGPFECCAVRVRLEGGDTTVASVYVRPNQPWDPRGRALRDTLQQLGLQILNTGVRTFIRGGGRAAQSAIDISAATEGCRYSWAPAPDTWGSDHLPLLLSPFRGKALRDREYQVVDWRAYRRLFKEDTSGRDLMQLVVDSARAATVVTKVSQGQPVPDIRHLALRAARRRAERQALSKGLPELWTCFRRVDAVCRRHARRRRNQGWVSVCVTIDSSKDGARAWRLLKCLLMVPRAYNQVLSVAVLLAIPASELAERLADQFASREVAQLATTPPPAALPCPASCHHPGWVVAQVQELCNEPIRMHELVAALDGCKRRSAPGADGITFQMLRNLEEGGRQRLLGLYNDVWNTGELPESWRTAVVAPILKPRKKATALSSYRPVSLTSAACKVLERVALERMQWIADQLDFFPERRRPLEDAKSCGDVAMLLLLDVESAFDGLPHVVVEAAIDRLGISGCLRGFVSAFLSGRTFCVRVGGVTSQPKDITTGVPQGSVLSPFLFNMALAGLPASLPTDTRFPARCSVYADDVALWARGPRRSIPAIRRSLQAALDAVISFLGGIGLKVSATKTEALLIHPLAAAWVYVKPLRVGNRSLPWRKEVRYLGLTVDHRLTWIPAAKAAATKVRRVQGAIGKLQQRGRGCSTKWALRLNQAAASSVLLYALPLVNLTPARRSLLEGLHRGAVRTILELPRCSPVAATLAEAREWPLTLRMLQRALGHIDHLHRAADGAALLERLRSLPGSRMGGFLPLYHQMVPDPPAPVASPPPHHRPPEVHLHLAGATKRRIPAAALQQAASCKLQEQLEGRLQVFTDGSVMPEWTAAAACVVPARTSSRQCKLPFPASSTAAELTGLHLAADLLAEDIPSEPVAVLCDSKAALQILANHRDTGLTGSLLAAKYRALAASGASVSFHWLPSHVGIAGNEEADALAKAAHQPGTPITLKKLLVTVHPDSRVASERGPKLLPETGLTRRDRSALLRLLTGCVWTAARRHAKGLCAYPACSRCGDPETLEHLLCACPGLAQERSRVTTAYRSQGLPASTCSSPRVPTCQHSGAWWSSWTRRE
ncbi:uncharacterized protein LOC125757867 [Rhipicephalus sanguineus]|uniref:uncharacterized protein LOC125757867 n=1 Tax=Rhipicephalus sanguineus TaxID=34632 RepID=UPI0020C2C230|nr:uncharacterized protein LOC125757867 [Rhipicephalus sanguineus]